MLTYIVMNYDDDKNIQLLPIGTNVMPIFDIIYMPYNSIRLNILFVHCQLRK